MNKLKLNFGSIGEILTREQLKHVVGGDGSGDGSGSEGGDGSGSGDCCLLEWYSSGQHNSYCNISQASAAYACRTRSIDNPDPGYRCSVICAP